MGLVYHFECENPSCDYEKDIYIGVGAYSEIPRDVIHVTTVDAYKEYVTNYKRCPECDSLLVENREKGGSW